MDLTLDYHLRGGNYFKSFPQAFSLVQSRTDGFYIKRCRHRDNLKIRDDFFNM